MAIARGARPFIVFLLEIVVFGGVLFGQPSFASAQQGSRHILILESNHAADPWAVGVREGLEAVFAPVKDDFSLYFEYLDAKRHPGPEYVSQVLEKTLPFKLAGAHFDLVVFSGNDAFEFGLRHRNDLFAGIPIVFCGIGNFQPSLIASFKGITGVSEWHSYRGTISAALALQPETKEIVVIGSSQTLTGRRNRQILLSWTPMFENRVRFTFWDDLSVADLTARLKELTEGSIVLLDNFVLYYEGHVLPAEKSLQIIRNASPVPIYSLWEFYLGKGIVGGKLINSQNQGRFAASMALKILGGEAPENIPVVSRDANEYMYDYGELKRFNLSMAMLPEPSVVINQPPSFYEINKKYLWGGVALLAILSAVTCILLLNIFSRRAAEKQLAIFRRFVEASAQGMGFAHLDGRIIYLNPTLRHLVEEETAEGGWRKTVAEYYSERCRDVFLNEVLPELGRGGYWQGEMELVARSGRRVPTLESFFILPDEKGKPLYLANVITDIGQRKQAEAALRESEERYRSLVENIDLGISLVNTDYRVVMVNAALARMNGRRPEDLAGKSCSEILTVCENAGANCPCATTVATGVPAVTEQWVRLPAGERLIRLQTFPIWGSDNRVSGFIGVWEDMTERKRVEEGMKIALAEAEESRDKISAILGAVVDGIIVTDLESRIVLMNPALEKILGLPLEHTFGRPVAEVIKDSSLRDYLVEWAPVETSMDFALLDRNRGEQRVFHGHTSMVKSREGKTTGFLTLLQDVTRQRELDEMKNEFISTAAHELRTPLAAIMGYAELLANPKEFGVLPAQEEQACLQVIYKKGEALTRIIDDLLDLSRMRLGLVTLLNKERGDIGKLIREAVEPYKNFSSKHQFEIILPTASIELSIDHRKIAQVMENLLSNAVKFSREGGVVRIKGEVVDNGFQVCVEDRGIGMSAEQVGKVFDKFYRADASNTAAQGLGVGMSIAKNIIEAHGGRIWIESVLNQGTSVFFALPMS